MATVRELVTVLGFDADDRAIKNIDRGVKNLTSSLKQMAVALVAAGAGVGALLNIAGKFEQIEIAFETMLGSSEKAKKSLDELFDFARRTPFEVFEVTEGAKRLLAFGFQAESLVKTLGVLGDISSGVGRDKLPQLILALGQVRAATKLRGQELRQFTEAGVPLIEELSKSLGVAEKDIQKLVSAGKVSFDDVLAAMTAMTEGTGRFTNLMAKQAKTFLGIISNAKDFITLLSKDIGKQLLPQAKALLNEFLGFIEANRELILLKSQKFFLRLAKFIGEVVDILKAMFTILKSIARLVGGLENLFEIILKLFLFLTSVKILSGIGLLAMGIGNLAVGLRAMGTAALFAQLKLFLIPIAIGAIIALIALIAEDIIAFSQGRDSVLGRFIASFSEAFPNLGKFATGFFNLMSLGIRSTISSVMLLFSIMNRMGSVISGFFNNTIRPILDNPLFKKAFELATRGVFNTGAALGNAGDALTAATNPGPDAIAASGGGGNKNVTMNNKLDINVQGLPPDVAKQVAKESMTDAIDNMLRQGGRELAPGVER